MIASIDHKKVNETKVGKRNLPKETMRYLVTVAVSFVGRIADGLNNRT